jgi:ATP-dependent Zn protease
MPDDLLNILSNSNKDIDNQKLMNYLSDQLSAEEKHEFEKELLNSEMMNDAVEGLEKFRNKKDVSAYAEKLNHDLQKQLHKKGYKKEKRQPETMFWVYFAIILILIIVVISFFVIGGYLK